LMLRRRPGSVFVPGFRSRLPVLVLVTGKKRIITNDRLLLLGRFSWCEQAVGAPLYLRRSLRLAVVLLLPLAILISIRMPLLFVPLRLLRDVRSGGHAPTTIAILLWVRRSLILGDGQRRAEAGFWWASLVGRLRSRRDACLRRVIRSP
jgi:hypothetical protein